MITMPPIPSGGEAACTWIHGGDGHLDLFLSAARTSGAVVA